MQVCTGARFKTYDFNKEVKDQHLLEPKYFKMMLYNEIDVAGTVCNFFSLTQLLDY